MKRIVYPYITPANQVCYDNASQAFECSVARVANIGSISSDKRTIRLENIGFYIDNPLDNKIKSDWRKWSSTYAEREWAWYLSHSRDVSELQKHAPTWENMHGGDCQVNSNYGWQWSRNKQLKKALDKLRDNPSSRQAWITLYDGKEIDDYEFDTPCTLNIGFKVDKGRLNMSVLMRSNDLIFGFCNDQYCFSMLQERVADYLHLKIGTYYHFAQDLHIYLPHTKVYPESINGYLSNEFNLK